MAIKTIQLRNIEQKVENMYEAVCIMSGQARRVLDDRIVEASIKHAEEEEEYGVFDEVEEKNPEDYIELEKSTTVAIEQFFDGQVKWKLKDTI
tara:strand:- start:1036 stop:1314 length:279 start_codon:yes stop_codon:yes gene_type:complete